MPATQNCSLNSHRNPHRNVLRVFKVCAEILCDFKSYFGFVVDKLSELVDTKIAMVSQFLHDHTAGHGLK